ncbi:MAG: DUF397 domain-containing protein [Pseudonocardiaceae bacterium]
MSQFINEWSAAGLPGITWRKSRHSNPSGNCVEVAALPAGEIAVRNSRHPGGPALIYTRAEIVAFLQSAKEGEYDDLTGEDTAERQTAPDTGIGDVSVQHQR